MPNTMDVHKLMTRLKEDRETEMVQYDLEMMLERELAKPESEIDTALIEEILKSIEDGPDATEKENTWKSIENKAQRRHTKQKLSAVRRIAACFLILIAVSALCIGSAYAFNWKFLLKFLKPLADSFGVYSANTIIAPESVQTDMLYDDEDTGHSQLVYHSPEEMPAEWKHFRVMPAWMPERFSFLQGSVYDDGSIAVVSATYTGENAFFNLTTNFFCDDEDVSSYEYQKTPNDPSVEIIADCEVTYYLNSDTLRLSASWIDRNVHYSIFGDITEEEMRNIVLGIVNS